MITVFLIVYLLEPVSAVIDDQPYSNDVIISDVKYYPLIGE
jgi:hypothetical protein